MPRLLKNLHLLILPFVFFSGQLFSQATPGPYTSDGTSLPVNYVRSWTASAPQSNAASMVSNGFFATRQVTQYADGLGRPLQTVVLSGSLAWDSYGATDVVTPIEYDAYGRELHNWLQYPSSEYNGTFKNDPFGEQASVLTDQYANVGGDKYFYGQTDFEASPLNRPIKTYAPGDGWVGNGKGVRVDYWLNTAADAVRVWDVSDNSTQGEFGSYATIATYGQGKLYKTVATDENNKQLIEFRDKSGRLILKKMQNTSSSDDGTGKAHTDWLCTYYIYDDIGMLRCVVQPKGVELLADNNWDLSDATILSEQCFRYEYDARQRAKMVKMPGTDKVYKIYDALNRIVMEQDGNMRLAGKWLVLAYDDIDRPIQTGILSDGSSFTTNIDAAYTSTSYPSSIGTLLNQTNYDDYSSLPSGFSSTYNTTWDSYLDQADNNNFPYPQKPFQNSTTTTKGMVTWTSTAVLGTVGFLTSAVIYDDYGREVQVQSENITGGIDISTTQYSWDGKPLTSVKKQQTLGSGAQETVAVTKIVYDLENRVQYINEKLSNSLVNGGNMSDDKMLSYFRYDALGQMVKKYLGPTRIYMPGGTIVTGSTENSTLEYQYFDYNIRGWLLGMNRTYVSDVTTADPPMTGGEYHTTPQPSPTAGHYFGFDLGYERDGIIGSYSGNYQLNGSIGGTTWKSAHDGQIRKYNFTYDAVDRVTAADFNQWTGGTFNRNLNIDFSVSGLSYDANGNIMSMQQTGLKNDGTSSLVDNLKYNYITNSNKLKSVTDFSNDATTTLSDFRTASTHPNYNIKAALTASSSQASFDAITDYTYDGNGNLTSDANKNITSIGYNYLDLPSHIVTGKGTIDYTYDATGEKLKKVTTEGSTTTITTYIDENIYQDNNLQFISSPEGRIRPNAAKTGFVFDYYLKDHLDNVRMTITDDPAAASTIIDATSYYPFGLPMKGIGYESSVVTKNKYKFNGNEIQEHEWSDGTGLDLTDFNARMYDQQIGRFTSIDPLAEQMMSWGNYVFVSDNPIFGNDPMGLSGVPKPTPPPVEPQLPWGTPHRITNTPHQNKITPSDLPASPQSALRQSPQLASAPTSIPSTAQTGITASQVVGAIVSAVPVVGPIKDIITSASEGDWKGVAVATVFLGIDLASSGLGGMAMHVLEKGVQHIIEKEAASFVEHEVGETVEKEAEKEAEGIIYKRTNPKTGEEYIGQAKSPERYAARQTEHDAEQGIKHDFQEIGRAKPGKELDVLEETHIRRHGGPKRKGGKLANKRYQMNDARYKAAGGTATKPTI